MAHGFHGNRLSLQFETTAENAVPEIESLFDVSQIIGCRIVAIRLAQNKTDLTEMQPMRIPRLTPVEQPC